MMKLDDYDFTYLAAARRAYPNAKIESGSVEGPHCGVRKCQLEAKEIQQTKSAGAGYRLKLFSEPSAAKLWVEQCDCLSRTPEDHLVRVLEALEPPEAVVFQGKEDWKLHHASELLQKWAIIAERLGRGPATEVELNSILSSAITNGNANWISGVPSTEDSDCMPTLCWANWHKMVRAEYGEDLTTIEFSL